VNKKKLKINVNLAVEIGSLKIKNPVMTASGTFGYGEEYADYVDLNRLGAIVVKGLSLSRFKNDILVDYSEEKKKMIEELFWMIEEYKVSLFAQELKTPYPVSTKKLNQLIKEIENTI